MALRGERVAEERGDEVEHRGGAAAQLKATLMASAKPHPEQTSFQQGAGRVDVAVTYEPYLQAALEEGDNCEIIYTAAERPGLISDALAVNAARAARPAAPRPP